MKKINFTNAIFLLFTFLLFFPGCSSSSKLTEDEKINLFETSKKALLSQNFVVEFDEDINPKQDFILMDNDSASKSGRFYYLQNGSGYDAAIINIKMAQTKKGNIVCTFEIFDPPLPSQTVWVELIKNSNRAYVGLYNKSFHGQLLTLEEFGFDITAEREKIKNRYKEYDNRNKENQP